MSVIVNKEDLKMTYHEKRMIVTSFIGIAVSISYIIFAITTYQSGSAQSLTLRFWAEWILIFIGIGVVAMIIGTILFSIIYPITISIKLKLEHKDMTDDELKKQVESMIKTDMVEDEMGKLIELKSMRIGFAFAGVGFVLSLISLLLNYSPIVMIHIIFLSFSIGSVLEGLASLYYYKKGIRHA
jgi:hypothetical protein